jgi:hypothetical protein
MTRASDLAKLLGAGATINDGTTITTADNTDQLTLISTDADANVGPNLNLFRNSGSPADDDVLGLIIYNGRNDNSQDVIYARQVSYIKDASDGTEDGQLTLQTMVAGTIRDRLNITPTEIAINEDSIDSDFRVESNGETHALFVQAGSDCIGIKTTSPNDYYADDLVLTAPDEGGMTIVSGTSERSYLAFADGTSGDARYRGYISYDHNTDDLYLGSGGSGHVHIGSTGTVLMPNQPSFQVRKSADQSNVSASDSVITVSFDTEVFDVNSDFASNTFTAPVTGKYFLSINVYLAQIDTAAGYILIGIRTSNRDYYRIFDPNFSADVNYYGMNFSVLADLDASDTAFIWWQSNGGTAQVDIIAANGTQFQGCLLS